MCYRLKLWQLEERMKEKEWGDVVVGLGDVDVVAGHPHRERQRDGGELFLFVRRDVIE